jgi:uncharacterized membrane protein
MFGKTRALRLYYVFAGVLICIAAIAKIISAFGKAPILHATDPIFAIPTLRVLQIVAILELIIASVCFFGKRLRLQAAGVAFLSSNFVVYRFGLLSLGYHKPCNCLGSLTESLHISERTADLAMKIILAYLLIGSYATLFWLWRQRKRTIPESLPAQ